MQRPARPRSGSGDSSVWLCARARAGMIGAMARLASAAALLAASCVASSVAAPKDAAPKIETRVAYDPSARDPTWRVEIRARGLAGARDLHLHLEDWGEWT